MFKKLFFAIMALLLGVAANAQEWVSFGNRAEGASPEVSVVPTISRYHLR
jgi:hypothetical protein